MKRGSFGKRQASEQEASESPLVDRILVKLSVADSDDPAQLVQQVIEYLTALLRQGAYKVAELSPDLRRCHHLHSYLSEVKAGGHARYVAACGWEPETLADLRDGLRLLNAEAYLAIIDEFTQIVDGTPGLAKTLSESGDAGSRDGAIRALDRRLLTLIAEGDLTAAWADWLRRLPQLEIVPDPQYAVKLEALCAANPEREGRRVTRQRESVGRGLTEPMRVAARLLGMRAGCLPVTAYGDDDPVAVAPDGRQGTAWNIRTRAGWQLLFLFEDVALLCDMYHRDGRKLTGDLPADQALRLAGLETGSRAGRDLIRTREVARVRMAEVADAIEAAQTTPVLTIARLFCRQLGREEVLEDVFAAGIHRSGRWLWMMETDQRFAIFSFNGVEYILTDMNIRPLARLSTDDVEIAAIDEARGRC